MTSELVVDVQPKEISIALLEDKALVEFQKEGRSASFNVGNMYLGRVKKLMPGLNACFVDVGFEKDAFLHYLDLGPQFHSYQKYLKQVLSDRKKLFPITKATMLPDIEKEGTVSTTLQQGQEVIVQIVKEPISTKGPRLTCELSFAGRYLVLIPFNDKVSVSQKIKSSEERARLKQLLQSIKPKNFGVIVRTVAEGKRVAELDAELKVLLKHWEETITKVQKAPKLPALVYEETSRTVAMLRDLFNPSYENIYVNDETVFHEIKDYVSLIAPERAEIVKLYKGQLPIFDNFGITKQIKSPSKFIEKDFPGHLLKDESISFDEVFAGKEWFPTATPAPQFGFLPLITGTLWVSFFAILFALPFGLSVAVYMSEVADHRTRSFLKPVIGLLSGIPSVVYGFFGLIVIVPLIQKVFNLPVGETGLAGSIVLAIMALPTIITVSEDAMRNCPRAMREASLALGATRWQTIYKVVIPFSISGITSGVVLGIGRAIGETMAVLMVTGNAAVIPTTILEPLRTIPATIAAELGEAPAGGAHYEALFLLGVVLFFITMLINFSVEYISSRTNK